MSCPIVIKTIDSLEEKGIYEHDTSRVLNKPAFIAYNDKWSQIAKDKFNLTNVDKMFNVVDGGLKKMLSGSSYLRDNKESITRAFVNQDFFNELQEKYDLANKPADTSVNRISEVNKEQKIEVKPGVEELFDSTPELAHAVYEALGYNTSNIDLKINRIGNRINVVTNSSNNKAQIDIDIEGKNAYITNTFVEKGQQGFGTLSYIKIANELIKQGLTLTSDLNGVDLQENGKALWESLVSKNLAFYNPNIGRYVFSGQQAQQLYSQYLDTIFPDSKVKEIKWHGSKQEITQFQKGFSQRGDIGIWFQSTAQPAALYKNDNYIKPYGDFNTPVILDIKNPIILPNKEVVGKVQNIEFSIMGNNLNKIQNLGYDAVTNDTLTSEELNNIKNNPKNFKVYETVVFEPEQIHILGNKQDIEGFKKFVKNSNKENNNTKIQLNIDFDVDKLSDDLNLDKDCK